MIFCAKNESGEESWKLVLANRKSVTRRLKPLPVGKEFAIQPGRGKFAVCRGRAIACMNSLNHFKKYAYNKELYNSINEYKEDEAHLEGFETWEGIMKFLQEKKINFADTFRIEFELMEE